ncbi:MAG: hypothetical protein WA776_13485 [Xanthobacteraceae bacterium]
MEKITRASIASRAVAEEESKAKNRFNDLVMNNSIVDTPLAADVIAERLHFFMNPESSNRAHLGFLHLKMCRAMCVSDQRRASREVRVTFA